VHKEILLPDAAEWMADRETLWNRVEAFEKRKDAQRPCCILFNEKCKRIAKIEGVGIITATAIVS